METPVFYHLLASTDVTTFEVASDAFLTFKARGGRTAALLRASCTLRTLLRSSSRVRKRCTLTRRQNTETRAQEVLSRHGTLTSAFLLDQTAPFFTAFNEKLLKSTNYVTRRQSLKARRLQAICCIGLAHIPGLALSSDRTRVVCLCVRSCWASCC
jgi:hypothetical protein